VKNTIKVLIVDDHNIVRDGLKLILELDDSIEVCGEAKDLKEALDLVNRTNPDVILLDYKFPDGDGVNGCINIKYLSPKVKIIILTAYSKEQFVIETIRAGADGYLLKNINSEELIKNIKKVYEGHSVLDTSVSEGVINDIIVQNERLNAEDNKLSSRETYILQMVSLGKANKEIAEALDISEKTVRNYVSSIFKKLNVSNRTEAASYWIRNKNLL